MAVAEKRSCIFGMPAIHGRQKKSAGVVADASA
jgi:hypothetical protein